MAHGDLGLGMLDFLDLRGFCGFLPKVAKTSRNPKNLKWQDPWEHRAGNLGIFGFLEICLV